MTREPFALAATMDDAAIEAEITTLEDRDLDIRRQLEDDVDEGIMHGPEWRWRARTARRHTLARLDVLKREQAKRTAAAKVERASSDGERERTRGELFVLAATEMLDKHVCAAIWGKAQAMYPDSPAWEQRPAVKKPPPIETRPTQTLRSLAELKALL